MNPTIAKLQQLPKLKAQGILSEEEFTAAKARAARLTVVLCHSPRQRVGGGVSGGTAGGGATTVAAESMSRSADDRAAMAFELTVSDSPGACQNMAIAVMRVSSIDVNAASGAGSSSTPLTPRSTRGRRQQFVGVDALAPTRISTDERRRPRRCG